MEAGPVEDHYHLQNKTKLDGFGAWLMRFWAGPCSRNQGYRRNSESFTFSKLDADFAFRAHLNYFSATQYQKVMPVINHDSRMTI